VPRSRPSNSSRRSISIRCNKKWRRAVRAGNECLGDGLIVAPDGPLVFNVSVVFPSADTYVDAASRQDGTAAAACDEAREDKFRARGE
jgi:hypothetical protein